MGWQVKLFINTTADWKRMGVNDNVSTRRTAVDILENILHYCVLDSVPCHNYTELEDICNYNSTLDVKMIIQSYQY